MNAPRCPGQDMRYWKPEDIFQIDCPFCGQEIEFWKDEPFRLCHGCGKEVRNPRMDLGCAKWCKFAKECLGVLADDAQTAAPVVQRLAGLLDQCLADLPRLRARAHSALDWADRILAAESAEPVVVKAAALITAAVLPVDGGDEKVCRGVRGDGDHPSITARADLPAAAAERTWAVVDAVCAGRDSQSPETRIVADAVALADRFAGSDAPTTPPGPFRTAAGRKFAGGDA